MRVYALAKELNVDNKVLMDLCNSIGIAPKGSSALASISDEDAQRVREHCAKKETRSGASPSMPVPMEPPRTLTTGRIPTLPSRPKKVVEEVKAAVPEEKPAASTVVASEKKDVSQEVPQPEKPEVLEPEKPKTPEKPELAVKSEEPAVEVSLPEEPVAEKEKKSVLPERKPEVSAKKPEKAERAERPERAERSGRTEKSEKREASKGRDASAETRREDRRTRGPMKGSSLSNTPLGRRLGSKGKEAPAHSGRSVAESIMEQAQLSNAPIQPNYKPEPTEFPLLHSARKRRGDGGTERSREERKPLVRLAPVPMAKAPTKKAKEPEAQKPEIRLPLDAIRAGKSGDESTMRRVEQELLEKKEKAEKPRSKDKDARGKGREKTAGDDTRRRPAADKGAVVARGPVVSEDASRGVPKKGKFSKGGRFGDDEAASRDSRLSKAPRKGRSQYDRSGDDDEFSGRRSRRSKHTGTVTTAPRKSSYVLQLPLTVRSFAEGVGLSAAKVLGKLFEMGAPTTITAGLDETTAELLADAFGIPVEIRPEVTLEEKLIGNLVEETDDEADLVSRPPVVTFLGHVDHGKTSLLDRIINIDVVSGEKGGITQHIRAYNVKKDNRSITFVDTPGHEAFTEMRARGANTTDIAVLVVAADDGVMPQTEEAISHAKAAGVPIIVALNKIDLPDVNEMRILQELSTNELTPSEWGGDVEVVRCSALTGQGIDDLLETILTLAELNEYRANPKKPARGVCIESSVQQGKGVIAKLLVQNGTLHTGDVLVCGATYGRVKVMADTLVPRKRYDSAGPAMPVNVLGLDEAPGAGDRFYVLDDIGDARRLAEERAEEQRLSQLAGNIKTHVTLEGLFDSLEHQEVQTLNVILRADVRGSIEAIRKELDKLEHDEVQIRILQASVGGVTEADVHLADASDAVIVGFNVVPDEKARVLAEEKHVQVREYDIIYQLTADIKAAMEGMLKPEEREKELGRALVQRTFQISRVGTVAGCRVLSGTILRDCKVRIVRDNRIIGTYPLDTLKREKDDAKEVREGYECGIRLANFNDVKEGDILQAFQVETIARTF
ncbi:MAG: translation initiation factor IF-2 [Planctomycetia bacterium]|nr:translation initiation factor IF-2 [Planctomycetia bacterium]